MRRPQVGLRVYTFRCLAAPLLLALLGLLVVGGAGARGRAPAARLRRRHRRARRRRGRRRAGAVRGLAAARRRRLARDLLARVALDHGRRDEPEPRGDGDRRLRRGVGDPRQRVRGPGRDRRRVVPGARRASLPRRWRRAASRRSACGRRRSSSRSSARPAPTAWSPRGSSASPSSRGSSPGGRAAATTPTTCGRRAWSGDATPYCKQVPARPNDDYALFDRDVMDEVLRTVREGVRGDGKTFSGGGRRPNLTFVNLPGVDSVGPRDGARRRPTTRRSGRPTRRSSASCSSRRSSGLWGRSVLVLLSDHSMEIDAEQELADRALHRGAGSRRATTRSCRTARRRSSTSTDARSPARFELLKRLRAAAIGQSVAPLSGPPATEALYREPNPADGGSANTRGGAPPGVAVVARRSRSATSSSPRSPRTARSTSPNPLTGNHGGPQTRDNFFAVIGGGPLVRRQALAGAVDPLFDDTERNPGQAENVDVAADRHAAARRARAGPERRALPGRGVRRPRSSPAADAAARAGGGACAGVRALPLSIGEAPGARPPFQLLPTSPGRDRRLPVLDRAPHPRQPPGGALHAQEGVRLARARRAERPAVRPRSGSARTCAGSRWRAAAGASTAGRRSTAARRAERSARSSSSGPCSAGAPTARST